MTTSSLPLSWLVLQQLPGMKPSLLRRLFAADPECSDPLTWLEWSPSRLRALGAGGEFLGALADWRKHGLQCAAGQKAQRDCDWLDARGMQLLSLNDPRYPPLLLEIPDPPPLLYVWGDAEPLLAPQIAVVGSRRPSTQGVSDAGDFAAALARAGFVIVSGLALGVDAAAHRAALDIGGQTIAVLGCGIDTIYPAPNTDLATAISRQGAVISEFPLGTPPRANQFPSRNRIISGLSLGVLVIEAAVQSGSLVTARLAAEQNREVFALPGSIHNPVSRGCNALIRQGATLVQSVGDMLEELRGWSQPIAVDEHSTRADSALAAAIPATAPPPELNADEAGVFAAIGSQPTTLDELLVAATQPLPALLAILAELELMGLIENRGGSYRRADGACTR